MTAFEQKLSLGWGEHNCQAVKASKELLVSETSISEDS
jgi:hypothetical protein